MAKTEPTEKKQKMAYKGQQPVSVNQGADSLKLAQAQIIKFKGKKYDPTVKNKRPTAEGQKLVHFGLNYLAPKHAEHKAAADSTYYHEKDKNPAYEGVPAKKLDEITGGKGKRYLDHYKAYQDYREIASPASQPSLKKTAVPEKQSPQSRFNTAAPAKEQLYVPDTLFMPKKFPRKQTSVSPSTKKDATPSPAPKQEIKFKTTPKKK